ncbi:hypothetical protein B0H10DRAFT_1959058 [Mycena sp. CBHHK59/15]|nr:hypothetical protein B0H10DRAFT_1959058 [Mycena sp. CBHHK59/15]
MAACIAVSHVRLKKTAWIAHLIGGKVACPHASAEAKADATAQHKEVAGKKRAQTDASEVMEPPPKMQLQQTLMPYQKNDMPFSKSEANALHAQALSQCYGSLKTPKMKILFGMLCTTAPAIIPTGKVLGGWLLDDAAADVELKTMKVLKGKNVGLSMDGWKCKKKDAINAICANMDFKACEAFWIVIDIYSSFQKVVLD